MPPPPQTGRRSLAQRLYDYITRRTDRRYPPSDQREGAPPVEPGYRPSAPPPAEEYDDIQLIGRDASYHPDEWRAVMDGVRLTPGSSNVHGYYYETESRWTGILYVTFLANGEGTGPGQTYAYYDVPVKKFHEFQSAAADSAGGAVWDYLRVRKSSWQHQHNYRLVQTHNEYVPRKATRRGFAARALPDHGVGRRRYRRNTLPGYNEPDRGRPDRGFPNRGRP